ncbi:MAG: VWA domain-containing protein [Fibrobacter sp.]|nr:VWA domain-containing protein [Fibrobacter sp.]
MKNTIASLGFILLSVLSYAGAAEICEFMFTDCPQNFNGDTIKVPQSVVALSSEIKACGTELTSAGDSAKLPSSIMFVIDHSGSMTGEGSGPNDQMGSRFTVTTALIDSIYKVQPNAEVGVVVFSEHLYFDKTSSQYFSSYFSTLPKTYDAEPNQAYLPLLKLNGKYGDKSGIDIIKDVLKTDTVQGRNRRKYVDLVYKPNFVTEYYTNINIGFIAAKDAMKSAANPAERQFVIFLSDGEPMGDSRAGLPANDFEKGTNMPTTFTVYFTSNKNAPLSLRNMTANIQKNGYSSSNPSSELWAIETNHNTLLNLLMDNVFDNILITGDPLHMVINGVKSTSFVNSSFVFPEQFPLQATITSFNATASYKYTDPQTNAVRDTNVSINFTVKRVPDSEITKGITLNCWEQPTLQFYYNGSPISFISEEMSRVEIRLDPNDETIKAATVRISSNLESENFVLAPVGTVLGAPVGVQLAAKGIAGDKIMQHIEGDSLVAVYKNPKIPLDSVRIAIPIVDKSGPVLDSAIYYPGRNGARDTLKVVFSEPVQCRVLTAASPGVSYNYYDAGTLSSGFLNGASYIGTCETDLVASVYFLVNQGTVVPVTDSMNLVGLSSTVKDKNGNMPSKDNPKVPVVWGTDNSISIAVSKNPFNPVTTIIPHNVYEKFSSAIGPQNRPGIIVGISSLKPLVKKNDSYGTAKIYDPLGNIIAKDIKIEESTVSGDYGAFWDGTNMAGRLVGTGIYLMEITVTDTDRIVTQKKIKVGMKR